MIKILIVIQFVLYVLTAAFVVIGGKYRLRVKKDNKKNILYYKNGILYCWIALCLFFISMILSAILFYKTNGYLNIH